MKVQKLQSNNSSKTKGVSRAGGAGGVDGIGALNQGLVQSFITLLVKNPDKDAIITLIEKEGVSAFIKTLLSKFKKVASTVLSDPDKLQTIAQAPVSNNADDSTDASTDGAADPADAEAAAQDIEGLRAMVMDKYITGIINYVIPFVVKLFDDINDGSVDGHEVNANLVKYSHQMSTWLNDIVIYGKKTLTLFKTMKDADSQVDFLAERYYQFKEYLALIIEGGDYAYRVILNLGNKKTGSKDKEAADMSMDMDNVSLEDLKAVRTLQGMEAGIEQGFATVDKKFDFIDLG